MELAGPVRMASDGEPPWLDRPAKRLLDLFMWTRSFGLMSG
jgi:hypothetical protein